MWAALVRQTKSAQPLTINAPTMAIAGAYQSTGSHETGSATSRGSPCK